MLTALVHRAHRVIRLSVYLLVVPYLCLFVFLTWLRCLISTTLGRLRGELKERARQRRLIRKARITRCNLCGSSKIPKIYEVKGLGDCLYPIRQCRSCGIVFLGRKYLDHQQTGDVRLWAATDRGEKEEEGESEELFLAYNRMREEPFGYYSGIIKDRLAGGKILDLGCANGYFLSFFPVDRWERWGVELNQDNFQECEKAGLENIFLGIFSDFQACPGSYDAISMIEFIEHCPDPLEVLTKCRQLLRPGGVLFLVTGNIESKVARQAGNEWGYLAAAPEHRFFFSFRTLSRILEKAGFENAELILCDEKSEVISVITTIKGNC